MSDEKEPQLGVDIKRVSETLDGVDWLCVDQLPEGAEMEIYTVNSVYTLTLFQPKECRVLIQGNGEYFRTRTKAVLQGSPAMRGSTLLKRAKIAVGYQVAITSAAYPGEEIILSKVRTVLVNGFVVLPIPDDRAN